MSSVSIMASIIFLLLAWDFMWPGSCHAASSMISAQAARFQKLLKEIEAGTTPLSADAAYLKKNIGEARSFMANLKRSKEADAVRLGMGW